MFTVVKLRHGPQAPGGAANAEHPEFQGKSLEASEGIEPPYKDVQSSA